MFGRIGLPLYDFKSEGSRVTVLYGFFHAVIYHEIKIKKVVLYGFCQPVQPFLLVFILRQLLQFRKVRLWVCL